MVRAFILGLLAPVKRWSWTQLVVGEKAGIRIVDASCRRESPEDFLRRTIDALGLVQRVDTRRFSRVCQHIRYVVYQELPFGIGKYDRRLCACLVDFARLKFSDHPVGALHIYAALLVHEATHGVIHHRGIPYTDLTRERIEHLCYTEEARFLRRIHRQLGDAWMERAYTRDAYGQEWKLAWWQRVAAAWKRRREAKGCLTNED